MNVTIVCDVLGEENNGTTIAAMNLIRSLKAKGHVVKVVCPDEEKRNEENYYIVPMLNLGKHLNNYVKKNGVKIAKADKDVIYEAVKDADVVHVLIPFFVGHQTVKICQKLGIPVTGGFHCQAENLTNHVFMMNAGLINGLTYKLFNKIVYKYCEAIHYPTEFICHVFEKKVGTTNHYVISNGVSKEFDRFMVPKPLEYKDKFVILFTGRYSKEKSHKVLLKAVSKSKYRDKIQIILAGEGPLKEKLMRYSKKLGISVAFNFYKRSELIEVINYADLYVHPAQIEIEAISCLEAMACGLVPIISNSKRSATKYFALDDRSLFKCNDSVDLKNKIEYFMENRDELKKLSDKYYETRGKFDFDSCMNQMEQMLIDAAKSRKNGPKSNIL